MPARKKAAPAKATRDREATEQRFIEAAARVIARDGAAGLGVNAIAAEAGADKKLIYRYFGGLDGLLEAMGANTAVWIGDALSASKGDYGQRMGAVFAAYAGNLRGDPVLQKLLAWELAGPSDTLRRIDAARSKAMYAVMPKLRGDEKPPEGVDAPAVNAILLAALHYLTLRGATMGGFSGLSLKTEADWKRAMAAFDGLLARTYETD
ncbi:MAG: helix-turn-helix domain-containing protein [Hyphomonadaceae bacterium]|nr:helix-turn-helix domain-containing protein [Hyphomonadaceae bacterium]